MKTKIIAAMMTAALLITLSAPAHAFRDTSLRDLVTQYGMDDQDLLSYVAGFRDAWAFAQAELVKALGGDEDAVREKFMCGGGLTARELLRIAAITHGTRQTTEALQKTLDTLCWKSVSS